MADFVLDIEGRLDKGKTKANIQKELNGNISDEINAQRPLQLVGSLDVARTKQRIQAQLATISKDLKVDINIGKVDVQSVADSLNKAVQKLQQSTKKVSALGTESSRVSALKAETQAFKDSAEQIQQWSDYIDKRLVRIDKKTKTVFKGKDGAEFGAYTVTGTDELGRQIEIQQKRDTIVTKTIDNQQKLREQAAKAAEKERQEYEKGKQAALKSSEVEKQEAKRAYKAVEDNRKATAKAAEDNRKAIEKQKDALATYETKLDNIRTKYSELQNPISGIQYNENRGTTIQSDDISDKAKEYANAYDKVIEALDTIYQRHQKNEQATEEEIRTLKSAIDEADRLGKVAHNAQSVRDKWKPIDLTASKETHANDLIKYKEQLERLGDSGKVLMADLEQLKVELASVGDKDDQQGMNSYIDKLRVFKSKLSALTEMNKTDNLRDRQSAKATTLEDQKALLNSQIANYLQNNTKLSDSFIARINKIRSAIDGVDDSNALQSLRRQFQLVTGDIKLADQAGKSFLQLMKEKAAKFSSWFTVAQAVMTATNAFKQGISTLKDVNTLLTEISKTSEMTAEQLENLGYTAFDSAKKYGVTVQSYLTGVQEMSRAGYQTNAQEMAELSILAQSAGDMTAQVANDYLIATDAAYEFGGSVKDLGKVLDGQNQITNNYAISMTDIADATSIAASLASEYGVSIEQLSGLITMAVSKTRQSGSEVGNAIKSLMVNLTDSTNKKRVGVFEQLGISMEKMVDGAKQMKTPIEMLEELARVYNNLPENDPKKALILGTVGNKRQGNVLAAILKDWDSLNGIMKTYESGVGSAERESKKSLESIQGQLNNLKSTGVQLVQDLVNTDDMRSLLKTLNSIAEVIHDITKSLGLFGTVVAGLGLVGTGKAIGSFAQIAQSVNVLTNLVDKGKDVEVLAESISGLSKVQQILAVKTAIADEALREEILATNGVTLANAGATTSTSALTVAETALGTAVTAVRNAFISLGKAMIANPAMAAASIAAVALAGGLIAVANHYKKYREEQHEQYIKEQEEHEAFIENAKQEYQARKENLELLSDIQDEYETLGSKTSLTATEEDRLNEIQSSLVETYGKLANGIDLVNGKYDENLAKLKELNKEETTRQRQQAKALYDEEINNTSSNGSKLVGGEVKYGNNIDYITAMNKYGIGIGSMQYADKHVGALDFSRYTSVADNFVQFYVQAGQSIEEVIENLDNSLANIEHDYTMAELDNPENAGVKKVYETLEQLRDEYLNIQSSRYNAAYGYAEAIISDYALGNVNWENVTEETYQAWRDALVDQYAKNDPTLRGAIDDKLKTMYEWLQEDTETIAPEFSFSSWFNANDLEDVEKKTKQLKSILEDVVNGKNISGEDRAFLSELGLDEVLDDTDALRIKLRGLAQNEVRDLYEELKRMLPYAKSMTERNAILNAMQYLGEIADITADITDNYDDQIDAINKEIKKLNELIAKEERRKKAAQETLEALKAQKESVENQIDMYEKAAQAVQDYISDQIDSLNEQKSAIEETYDKQIDALKDEADEREKINDLREKELALENAKNSKVRTYTASGWQIVENSSAVKQAQEEYEKALNDSKVAQLEKERDEAVKPIEDQIKALEDYKKAWSEALNHYERVQNEMYAQTIFGSNWRSAAFNADANMVNSFVSIYDGLQNQLHNIIEPQIEQKERDIEAIDKQIEAYNELKTQQQSYLDFINTYSKEFSKAIGEQKKALEEFLKLVKEGKDQSGIFRAFDTVMQYYDKTYASQLPGYANGGTANFTGQAMLHGTSSRAELILNNADARKLYEVIHGSSIPQLTKTVVDNMNNSVRQQGLEAINNATNTNSANNYYSWTITGNDIHADNYSRFKECMDRFVRESRMNLAVGKA